MKTIMRNRILTALLLLAAAVTSARAVEVMRFDFEDPAADTLWHYLHPGTNNWMIGNDMLNADRQLTRALYISNDGTYFDYNTRISQVAWAWTEISIDRDSLYFITYDYNCYGEYNSDYFLLFLVADTIGVPETPNSPAYMGMDVSFNNCSQAANMPAGAYLLNNFMPTGTNEWRTRSTALQLTRGRYRLVLFWTNDNDYGYFPAAIDNIIIERQGDDPDPGTDPEPEPESALHDTKAPAATKVLRDGRLLIRKGESVYDVLGRRK